MNPASPQGQTTPPSLSAWSIICLIMLALGIPLLGIALMARSRAYGPSAGPAEGAAVLFLLVVSYSGAGACALLGALCGLVGVRRAHSSVGLARTSLVLNAVIGVIVIALVIWFFLNP